MKSATVSGGTTRYRYDGDGRRVHKEQGATVTTYVYDATGRLAAEYTTGEPATGGTQYLTTDHLGSTRLVTNATAPAQVVERHDYEPFGTELLAAAGSLRQTIGGFTDLGAPIKFTGKERDAETKLDYFGARYLSSAQGRFTSADSPFADQHAQDPQSWNLYSYALNNPVRYVDPNGRGVLEGLSKAVDDIGIGWLTLIVHPEQVVGAAWNAVSHPIDTGKRGVAAVKEFAKSSPDQKVTTITRIVAPMIVGGVASRVATAPTATTGLNLVTTSGPKADAVINGVANSAAIVRGGTTSLPASGTVFSGAQGSTLTEAAAGVPHGTIRSTTAAAIRDAGGAVESAPELTRGGVLNKAHVNVVEGSGGSTFSVP